MYQVRKLALIGLQLVGCSQIETHCDFNAVKVQLTLHQIYSTDMGPQEVHAKFTKIFYIA